MTEQGEEDRADKGSFKPTSPRAWKDFSPAALLPNTHSTDSAV